MTDKPGILYLCATPIGNLEDMTYRAVRILGEVAAIAAEDTRHTRKLLSHYSIHTPLISYHEHNKSARGPELIAKLLSGEDLAVVSDAGLPGISDPGADLVRLAISAGIQISPLPGPNAALSALICSGLDTRNFFFTGFLPKTTKKRREFLAFLATSPHTLVFYESPHRLVDTLEELSAHLGNRPIAAGREITKKFEEFQRGTINELIIYFREIRPRGEFTLVVAGNQNPAEPPADLLDPVQAVMALIESGIPKKQAIQTVASEQRLSKREVYQMLLHQSERQG